MKFPDQLKKNRIRIEKFRFMMDTMKICEFGKGYRVGEAKVVREPQVSTADGPTSDYR